MEGEELEKAHLWHKLLAKPCPGLRQQFCLLLVLKGCMQRGLAGTPRARGSVCLSEQPARQGGERAEMATLLLLVEVSLKSQMHLQFGAWMYVQKQPGYRSPVCCDPGPCAAPSDGARAHVGSADEQREAWSYKNLGLLPVPWR